jgi:AcrR family transcriptional regulator
MGADRSDAVKTRQRLLAAAESIFALKGFHDTKIADICQRASANVAAVNHHFGWPVRRALTEDLL